MRVFDAITRMCPPCRLWCARASQPSSEVPQMVTLRNILRQTLSSYSGLHQSSVCCWATRRGIRSRCSPPRSVPVPS